MHLTITVSRTTAAFAAGLILGLTGYLPPVLTHNSPTAVVTTAPASVAAPS